MVEHVVDRGSGGDVLRVRLTAADQSVTVVGWCRYWIDGDMAGGFACPDHPDIGGPVSYRWDGERFECSNLLPPSGIDVLVGEWVPDEEWFG